jgi:monofunctional biosynthetic peptidoglycan transglycosylase
MKKRKWTYKLLVRLPLLFMAFSFALVLLLRYVPIKYTPLMLKRSIENRKVESFKNQHTWVSLDKISHQLAKAVVLTEDQKFYQHHGFDWEEIRKMSDDHLNKGTKIRGCSTISQQTAKNVFTFGSRTGARKICEAYWTVLIELLWSKDRIMEVYLNVIEMGPGIYGAEAVAEHHFRTTASELTREQCALIAATLPNPRRFDSSRPSPYMLKRQRRILHEMKFVQPLQHHHL